MSAFVAVLGDLWRFVFVDHFRGVDDSRASFIVPALPVSQANKPTSTPTNDAVHEVTTPQRFATETDVSTIAVGETVYISEVVVKVHLFPTHSIDGVVATLHFGDQGTVKQVRGSWIEVANGDVGGWIRTESVTTNKRTVRPQFVSGSLYDYDNSETLKLRRWINDEFAAGDMRVPLQDIEYVLYRLFQAGRTIDWPKSRPRIAGLWQQVLRGAPGVHIGIHPKTGSIMEVVHEDGTGHVYYVEAVFPDQAVRVSTVGSEEEGVYSESTIAPTRWRESRPVFIEIL